MLKYIVGFIFLCTNAIAQNSGKVIQQYKYIKYTNADGLNHLECLTIQENKKGQYYIATTDGISIMDGTGIKKHFTTEKGFESKNIITFNKGFVANEKIAPIILIEKNRIKRLVNLDPNNLLDKRSQMIACGKDSVIVFSPAKTGNKVGIIYYNYETGLFSEVQFLNKELILLEALDNKFLAYEEGNNNYNYYLYNNKVIIDSFVLSKSKWSINNNLLYSNNGLFIKPKIANEKIVVDTVFKFVLPKNNTYLKCFPNNNILLFVNQSKLFVVLNGKVIMLSDFTPYINDAYIDLQNNLWLCTASGLYNFYKCGIKTILFKGAPEIENQIDYVSKYGKEFRFSSIFSGFLYSKDNLVTWQKNEAVLNASKRLSNGEIIRGRSGNIKTVEGLEINALKNELIINKNNIVSTIKLSNNDDDKIAHIVEDPVKHKCYIASYLGVYELDNINLKVKKIVENKTVEQNGYFVDIILDPKGTPLVASRVVEKLVNGTLINIKRKVEHTTNHFTKDKEDNIWVGQNHQLFILKPNEDTVSFVAEIPNATVINTCAVYKEWIVLGTWYELIFFNKDKFLKTGEIDIKKFGKSQGLKTIKGGVHSLLADEDENCVYWPCNDIFYKVYPEILLKNYSIYKEPIIKSILAVNENGNRLELTDSTEKRIIKIGSAFRNLTFNIGYSTQLNIGSPILKYKLIGFQDKWVDGNNLEIRYYNLPPGTYQLEIQMTVDKNEWSKSIFSEKIIIKAYWYETLIFKFIIIALILGLLYLLYRFRINQFKKIIKVRRKISSDLHDDIGSTLSSINMYSQIAKLKPNDPQYVDNIQQSTKEVLEKLDDIVWATNPKNDKLENLVDRIEAYAKPLLKAKAVDFIFNYNEALNQTEIYEAVRQNLFLICKEAINNIAKYAEATTCTLIIELKGKSMFCTITDNGKGFDANSPTQRNGIKNMQMRAAQIKGNLSLESNLGAGTIIKVKIPL